MPKSTQTKGKDTAENDVTVAEATPAPVASGPPSPPSPPEGARRAPGQKEVIPFAWKICGYSTDGYTLTLFKSVERADCDAQLERLQGENYYEGLAIYKVDEPVQASPRAKQLQAVAKKKEVADKKKSDQEKAARKAAASARNKAKKPAARPASAAKKKVPTTKKTKAASSPAKTKGSRTTARATKRVPQKRAK